LKSAAAICERPALWTHAKSTVVIGTSELEVYRDRHDGRATRLAGCGRALAGIYFGMCRDEEVTMPPAAVSHRQVVAAAKALAHPARLRIVAMLRPGELCVCQMSTILQLAASTVSGHLNDLRRSGLVIERKEGKLVYYALDVASPFAGWVRQALELVAFDAQVLADAALIGRVRAVPIPLLTRGDLSLEDIRRRRTRPGAPA
jgi:DNA-binding transcriptional ArsR family regulator